MVIAAKIGYGDCEYEIAAFPADHFQEFKKVSFKLLLVVSC